MNIALHPDYEERNLKNFFFKFIKRRRQKTLNSFHFFDRSDHSQQHLRLCIIESSMAKRPQQPFMPRVVLIPRTLVPSATKVCTDCDSFFVNLNSLLIQVKPLPVENNESSLLDRVQSLSQKEPVSSFDSKSSNIHDNTQTTRITAISDIERKSSSSIISKDNQRESSVQAKKIYERFQDWWK